MMRSPRSILTTVDTLARFTWALLWCAPAIVTANHLYAAPFGAQLDSDFDSAAASWPSPGSSSQLRPLGGHPPRVGRAGEIAATRLSGLRRPLGD
jgi:hypothetical protein